MSNKLFIFIEGNDDELFIKEVVIGQLLSKKNIKPWKYSQKSKEKINDFINSINSMGADYIFITDFDEGESLETKKSDLLSDFPFIDGDRLVIVKNEIESWYIAGINQETGIEIECKKELRKIRVPEDTEPITKEHFEDLIPGSFKDSKIDFMKEILKCFDISIAKERNDSFKNFVNEFCMM
jgi:hypothetical protein